MSSWNRLFTNMIRTDKTTYWGNWSLDSSIKPGAIGTLLSDSGTFKAIGDLKDAATEQENTSIKWQLSSANVSKSEHRHKTLVPQN